MGIFHVVVEGKPPVKQTPANKREKLDQQARTKLLRDEAGKEWNGQRLIGDPCWMRVEYRRSKGASDSANIIGGIADSLQKIVISDDRQLVEIHYTEKKGSSDMYDITVGQILVPND